ncbi:MAG: O-succinylbenzoic acid--CoA ligase [Maribacter sp.]|jgi:O-succinylbenzoic acid--CoA ligase
MPIWKNIHSSLVIHGETLDKSELIAKARGIIQSQLSEEWKKIAWRFILEWLNDEPTIIVQTSGSTGKPKSIFIRKENMINSALATGEYFQTKPKDKALLCLPCNYIAGKMMVVRAFVLGLDLWLSNPSEPSKGIDTFIDFAAMVPLQIENLLLHNLLFIHKTKQLIIGGAAVSSSLLAQLQSLKTQCFATYGMTETITHIAIKILNGNQASDDYQLLPNVRIEKDERDCLVIHAPKIATEKVITNDIVEIISPQKFRWIGRFDNVINSGGIKLFPEQIEQKLNNFISCRYFISSLPDKKLGEKLVLVIEEEAMTIEELSTLKNKISSLLGKFEQPKEILFTSQFIETATGKLKRNETLEQCSVY